MRDTAYYILSFPLYGKFAFYGREYEAYESPLPYRTARAREWETVKAIQETPETRNWFGRKSSPPEKTELNGVSLRIYPRRDGCYENGTYFCLHYSGPVAGFYLPWQGGFLNEKAMEDNGEPMPRMVFRECRRGFYGL